MHVHICTILGIIIEIKIFFLQRIIIVVTGVVFAYKAKLNLYIEVEGETYQ